MDQIIQQIAEELNKQAQHVANVVQLLDNVMVGQVGTVQMSGVAIVNQLIFIFSLCVFGATSGAGIFTAQFHGSGNPQGIRDTFRFKILVALLLTLLLRGVGRIERENFGSSTALRLIEGLPGFLGSW